jgi:hypothetical protein
MTISKELRHYAKLSALATALDNVSMEAADAITNAMDEPWYALSDEELDGINSGSIDLWEIGLAALLEDCAIPPVPR